MEERTLFVKKGPRGYTSLIVPTHGLEDRLRGIERTLDQVPYEEEIRIDGLSESEAMRLALFVARKKAIGTVTRVELIDLLETDVN